MLAKMYKKRALLWPFLFLVPAFVLYAVFFIYPFLYALVRSFQDWDFQSSTASFVGFRNYAAVFQDEVFWIALKNTLFFMLMTVPAMIVIGLALALLLESVRRLRTVYRVLLYLPVVSSVAVVAIIWSFMYDFRYGVVNQLLALAGIAGPNWLGQANTALWAVAIADIWKSAGSVVVLFIAGLKSIDGHLHEAAAIDGAGTVRRFFRITLPLLSPMMLFIVIIGIISSFQNFAFINILTMGGPNNATNVLVYQIYQEAFRYFQMEKSAAISMLLFVLVLVITLCQMWASRKLVHYQ